MVAQLGKLKPAENANPPQRNGEPKTTQIVSTAARFLARNVRVLQLQDASLQFCKPRFPNRTRTRQLAKHNKNNNEEEKGEPLFTFHTAIILNDDDQFSGLVRKFLSLRQCCHRAPPAVRWKLVRKEHFAPPRTCTGFAVGLLIAVIAVRPPPTAGRELDPVRSLKRNAKRKPRAPGAKFCGT